MENRLRYNETLTQAENESKLLNQFTLEMCCEEQNSNSNQREISQPDYPIHVIWVTHS